MKMNGINKLTLWMTERIEKVNPVNPKANAGFVTLKGSTDWRLEMQSYVFIALQLITARFCSDSNDSPRGQTKLTEISAAIGRAVIQRFTDVNLSAIKHVQVGDCFLGAFSSEEFISIYRDESYSEHDIKAPYIIEATEKFAELGNIPEVLAKDILRATTDEVIPAITGMLQGHGRGIIKNYNETHEASLLNAIETEAPWVLGVDKLQSQGWKINRQVFDIVDAQFDSMIKDVPPRPHLGSPKNVKVAFKDYKANPTPATQDKFNREVELWNVELESLIAASKNVELNIIRLKTQELLSYEEFFQYVECDYRGRVYYQEPMMNYQGPDMARGLMLFSEGKALDERGKFWLAVHTASSYNETFEKDKLPEYLTSSYRPLLEKQGLESISLDKMSLIDRALWTYNNLDKIITDAEQLVRDAEKPVSYLAACVEWVNYLSNPKEHISYLPIPIDGTCNGYQHSAAISKDEMTGELVALVPTEIPGDLYVKAAQELVARKKDFFDARPTMRMKHIRKGIAKRGVMTRAYSAGKDKISDSMYKDCHTEGFTKDFNITMLDCLELGSELYDLIKVICPGATRTMEFLQSLAMFDLGTFDTFDKSGKKVSKSAKKKLHMNKQKLKKIKEPTAENIKDLNDVASLLESYETRLVRGNGNRHLEWVTPSGFHVIYEAYMTRDLKIRSTIPGYSGGESNQAGRIRHVLQENTPFPNVSKFQAGISPNMIHSIDSSHMMGVIANWDGSFGAVHDSFSAHASDIDALAKLTREVFVDIYDSEDPYADIANMVLNGDAEYDKDLPELGNLEITEVLKSEYFFC